MKNLKVNVGFNLFFFLCISDYNQKLMWIKQSKKKENKYLPRLISAVKLSAVMYHLISSAKPSVTTVCYPHRRT